MMELSGAAKATVSGFKILGTLGKLVRERRAASRAASAARDLIGIRRADLYSYRVAMNHPLHARGEPHPDDRAGFCSVADADVARAIARGRLDEVDEVSVRLDDGLVLIGSPEAEAVTRLVFGYVQYASGQGMRYVGDTIDLPYRWQEDPGEVRADCARYVPGRGLVVRPNWPIIAQVDRHPRTMFPTTRNDGLLENDFLLITKVPNFLTVEALHSGRSIISIAGSHGTGTRAIDLVLRSRPMLTEISARLRPDARAFQLLVQATGIEHDPRRGSVAKAVRLIDIQQFDRTDSEWAAATRVVGTRRGAWLAEVSKD